MPPTRRVHGAQAGAFYNGYYGDYCFLPLYVFCGERLLVSYLRPSNLDGARHASRGAGAVSQSAAPKVAPGADARARRQRLVPLEAVWLVRSPTGSINLVGVAKNTRLNALSAELQAQAEAQYQQQGAKVRLFGEFQ
jgi:hypothetical protein